MSERPGSLEARKMYKSSLSLQEWEGCIRKYSQAVSSVSSGKSKVDLVNWDEYLWSGLLSAVGSRNPNHIVLSELADVMKWKLARGKARPLQKLVESNSPASVISASTEAFKFLEKGNWEKAIDSVTTLKAVGVATATAILAPFAPALIPFMADEVMEAVSIKRDYTMKIYKELRVALITKATELQEVANQEPCSEINDWTAELVGKALWVKAMMTVYPEITQNNDTESEDQATVKQSDKVNASTTLQKSVKRKSTEEEEEVVAGSDSQDTTSTPEEVVLGSGRGRVTKRKHV